MECDDATRASWLLPTDSLVAELPRMSLGQTAAIDIKNGKVVIVTAWGSDACHSVAAADDASVLLRLYDPCERFLGLGKRSADGTLRAERLMGTHGD